MTDQPLFRTNKIRRQEKEFLRTIVAELVEVLIHQIIYLKRIYPDQIFVEKRRFNSPVMMSIQPWINDYIESITEDIKKNIHDRKAYRIYRVNVIFSRRGRGYQKFKLKMPKLDECWYEDLGYGIRELRRKMDHDVPNMLLRLTQVMAGLKEEPEQGEEEERDWWVTLTIRRRHLGMLDGNKLWLLAEDGQYSRRGKVVLPVSGIKSPLTFQLNIETDQSEVPSKPPPLQRVESEGDIVWDLSQREEEEEKDSDSDENMFVTLAKVEVESEEDKLLKAIRHSMDVERIDVDSEEDMFGSQSPIKNPFKLEDLDMDAESDKDMFLSSSDSSTKEEKVEVVDSDEDMFAEYY